MRWLAVLIAFSSGCHDDAVSIEIDRGDTGADRVELYLVDDRCFDESIGDKCKALKTPSAAGYLDGQVYTDGEGRRFAAAVDAGGIAYFKVVPDGDATYVDLAIAVGFRGTSPVGAIELIGFDANTGERRRATLRTLAGHEVTGTATTDGLRVETWYGADHDSACVAYELRENGQVRRDFVVPVEDPDCDDWMGDAECEAYWPDHTESRDPLLPFTCTAAETSGPHTTCLLGDAPCIDGNGPRACAPVTPTNDDKLWCVASAVCDVNCPPGAAKDCVYRTLADPPPVVGTRVACTVPVITEVDGLHTCNMQPSIGKIMTPIEAAGTTCEDFAVASVSTSGFTPFAETTTVTRTGHTGTLSVALESGCALKLAVDGTFDPLTQLDAFPDRVVRLELSTGYALVLPVSVTLMTVATCPAENAAADCRVIDGGGFGDESLVGCATSP